MINNFFERIAQTIRTADEPSSEILTFIFNTSRELPKEKADFANIEHMIMCTNKDFVSTLIFEYNRPLSHSGHFESQENKKLCFCPSSLARDKRSDGQNLLFQHRLIKVYTHWKALESLKICEQTFACFQSLFLRPPLHNLSASQAELVTDCWDERTVSWTLAHWTLACHFAQLKNVCCLTHRRAISPSNTLAIVYRAILACPCVHLFPCFPMESHICEI